MHMNSWRVGAQFQSKLNQSLVRVALMMFDSAFLGPGTHVYQSNNKVIDKDLARINGKNRFKMPEDVDAFVLEYTQAISFGGK